MEGTELVSVEVPADLAEALGKAQNRAIIVLSESEEKNLNIEVIFEPLVRRGEETFVQVAAFRAVQGVASWLDVGDDELRDSMEVS